MSNCLTDLISISTCSISIASDISCIIEAISSKFFLASFSCSVAPCLSFLSRACFAFCIASLASAAFSAALFKAAFSLCSCASFFNESKLFCIKASSFFSKAACCFDNSSDDCFFVSVCCFNASCSFAKASIFLAICSKPI